MNKRNCRLRFENKTGCCGECWLNTAGSFHVWETFIKYCKGTEEESIAIGEMFHGKRNRQELLDTYNLTEEDRRILIEDSWF
ncbi:hypothetical protein ACR77J_07620 [Tissierella praeacuta]|uniref:hypothetical protein n=1 Tax=Tissierella praeacuta TaxID=43131 RepID=UPI003DA51169